MTPVRGSHSSALIPLQWLRCGEAGAGATAQVVGPCPPTKGACWGDNHVETLILKDDKDHKVCYQFLTWISMVQ